MASLSITNLFVSLLILLLSFSPTTAQTVSLGADRELLQQRLQQRDCVVDCLAYSGGLWGAIGCSDQNSCLYRADLRPAGSSYLESCIYTAYSTCSNGVDYTAAVNIYDRYCTFTAPATVVVTATPLVPVTRDNRPVTVTYFTSAPTVTVASSDGSSKTMGESEWVFVATVASLVALVSNAVLLGRISASKSSLASPTSWDQIAIIDIQIPIWNGICFESCALLVSIGRFWFGFKRV